MHVLLVEDSQRLQELLSEALTSAGYKLDIIATARRLLSRVAATNYDLTIIDPGLGAGGFDAIRILRATGVSVPVIIITERGNIEDRIIGLDGVPSCKAYT